MNQSNFYFVQSFTHHFFPKHFFYSLPYPKITKILLFHNFSRFFEYITITTPLFPRFFFMLKITIFSYLHPFFPTYRSEVIEKTSSSELLFYPYFFKPDTNSINFTFNIWKFSPDLEIEFIVESHNYDLIHKFWIYTMEMQKYLII